MTKWAGDKDKKEHAQEKICELGRAKELACDDENV
jgi:hypothetical protein